MTIPTVKFPSAIDDDSSLFKPFNIYYWKSYLKLGNNSGETILTLTDGDTPADIPSGVANNFIGIDDEIMFVESVDNSGTDKTISVIRGCGDSTAASHVAGSLVQQVFSAELHNQLKDAIIAIENHIGTSPIPTDEITLTPTSDPYDYTFSGLQGQLYRLLVKAHGSDYNNRSTKVYDICHWSGVGQTPEAVESFIGQTGSGVDSSIENLVAGSNNFTVRLVGCNGGEAKLKVTIVGGTY